MPSQPPMMQPPQGMQPQYRPPMMGGGGMQQHPPTVPNGSLPPSMGPPPPANAPTTRATARRLASRLHASTGAGPGLRTACADGGRAGRRRHGHGRRRGPVRAALAPQAEDGHGPDPESDRGGGGQRGQVRRRGVFETSEAGRMPPLVSTDFACRDMGNCNPRFMRSSIYAVPNNPDMLKQSRMPFVVAIPPSRSSDTMR